MASKDHITAGGQTEGTESVVDTKQILLATLTEVFSTFEDRLRTQTPKPFEGAALVAVNTFNDIVAGLNLQFPPDKPNLTVKDEDISSGEIKLHWTDDTTNAEGFKVWRCQGDSCEDFVEIKTVSSSTRTYLDDNLASKTTYRYKLTAFNSRGEATSAIASASTKPPESN